MLFGKKLTIPATAPTCITPPSASRTGRPGKPDRLTQAEKLLTDQHTVAVAEEAVFLGNGFSVSFQDEVATGKGSN
jgi:hypothetical protein